MNAVRGVPRGRSKSQAVPSSIDGPDDLPRGSDGAYHGVNPPMAFKFSGTAAGIKRNGKSDVGLITSAHPCAFAAAYTANHLKAAPLLWNVAHLRSGVLQAVVANSGNANAATGSGGLRVCDAIAGAAAKILRLRKGTVALASTGVIGKPLPADRIIRALPRLARDLRTDGWKDFARAIMTTDTRPKISQKSLGHAGGPSILGIAKGAGMIGPHLLIPSRPHATMLAFIMTDARITSSALREALHSGLPGSFNAISVDGDMSTNDTVFVMASGASSRKVSRETFRKALHEVMGDLAMQIVRDGEGATKFVSIRVRGAGTVREAEIVARAIGQSPLVKTAIFGEDPNWGRILSAAGSTSVLLRPERTTLRIAGVLLFRRGRPAQASAIHTARRLMKNRDIGIHLDLGVGDESFTLATSDLSPGYVTVNAKYD